MDKRSKIRELRRVNTQTIIDNECGGSIPRFAEKLDKETSQTRQWLPGKKGQEPKKPIGSVIAAQIEIAFRKPDGWLDVDHSNEDQADREKLIIEMMRYVEKHNSNLPPGTKGLLFSDVLREHERASLADEDMLHRAINMWLSFKGERQS